ncbi:polysaccharide deacetylase family protein [Clostridium sp. CTA-5]
MKNYAKYVILIVLSLLMFCNSFTVNALQNTERKIVYLTFDDGPSPHNTENILSILNENNVRATFCVIGSNALRYKNTIKHLDEYNMAIIPHCNNHKYDELYSSTEYYINDLKTCMKIINNLTNKNKTFNFVRMPGGSDNLVCNSDVLYNIKTELKRKKINYIDWSVDSGDASAKLVSAENIENNIQKQVGINKIEVVLMHDLDNKITTADALQDVIDRYKKLGYEFKTLNEVEDWEIEYLTNKRIINK